MDFSHSPSELAFRDRLRAFLDRNHPPVDDGSFEVGLAWQRTLQGGQWLAPHWPVEFGGQGATLPEYAIYVEEMSRLTAPQTANRIAINMIGPTILVHGTQEQRERYLAPILSGDSLWCQLFSEPDAGSDLASVATRAVDHGDHWRVTGQKVWSSFALAAQQGVLLARTEPSTRGPRGLSYLVCDMSQPGVEVRPIRQITGEAEFGEVFLTDAVVPKSDVIGGIGDGWQIIQTTLANERGIAFPLKEQVALAAILDKLLTRLRAAPDVSPRIRQRAVDDWMRSKIFQLLNIRTLTMMADGQDPGARASLVKIAFSDLAQHLHETIIQFQGGASTAGDPADWRDFLWYRSASISGGTCEVQRSIIGERTLGLPRELRAP